MLQIKIKGSITAGDESIHIKYLIGLQFLYAYNYEEMNLENLSWKVL